jgi:hypothetical protein
MGVDNHGGAATGGQTAGATGTRPKPTEDALGLLAVPISIALARLAFPGLGGAATPAAQTGAWGPLLVILLALLR